MGSREEERLAPSHTACGKQPGFGLVSPIQTELSLGLEALPSGALSGLKP